MVPVIDKDGIQLMPCSERRAKKLMDRGSAKPYWQYGVFCIKMLIEPSQRNYQDDKYKKYMMNYIKRNGRNNFPEE